MHSSSIVHLVLASQPVLSISVAVRVAASSAHPRSWLRSVPVGAQEGAPSTSKYEGLSRTPQVPQEGTRLSHCLPNHLQAG